MKYCLFLLLFLSAFFADCQIYAVEAPCTEDTYVVNGSAVNNSTATTMYIDVNGVVKRAYLKFDIASLAIPAEAIIYSAKIRLKVYDESGVTTSTHTVKRVNASWSESTITYAGQPALSTSDQTSSSSLDFGYRRYDVLPQVRNMILSPAIDFGFCIHRTTETTSASCRYYSSNSLQETKPVLEIQYYFPYQVTAAVVYPATTTGSSDGDIRAEVSGGPFGNVIFPNMVTTPVNTVYQWYNGSTGTAISGATTPVLSGVGYGWYGLKIESSPAVGEPVYMAFIVGLKCQEATVSFNPGPDYVDDVSSNPNALVGPFDPLSVIEYAGFQSAFNSKTSTLIKFRLWISPELQVTQANLNLFGASHVGTDNAATLYRNTQDFEERPRYYGTYVFPGHTLTGAITLPNKTVSPAEDALNIDTKHFWNEWRNNNLKNYGIHFISNTTSGTTQSQEYHSSDATTPAKRPNIQFKVNRTCQPYSYSQLKQKLDGGYAIADGGILKVYFDETYAIAPGKYLPLRIYDASHTLKGAVNLNGTVTGSGGTPLLSYQFDDNRYAINLLAMSLTQNTFYVLEVETASGEKRYIKFLYKN